MFLAFFDGTYILFSEPPSSFVSVEGNMVVRPRLRRFSVAEDSDFQSLLALMLSVAEWLEVLVSRVRSAYGSVLVAVAVV